MEERAVLHLLQIAVVALFMGGLLAGIAFELRRAWPKIGRLVRRREPARIEVRFVIVATAAPDIAPPPVAVHEVALAA